MRPATVASPRHRSLAAVTIVAVGSLLAVAPARPADAATAVTAADRTSLEMRVESLVLEAYNAARVTGVHAGGRDEGHAAVRPLEGWTDMLTVARRWSDRQLAAAELAHNPDYPRQYDAWRGVAENVGQASIEPACGPLSVASAQDAAARVLDAWWASDPHRSSWMSSAYDHVAIGASLGVVPTGRSNGCSGTGWWALYLTVNFRDHDGSTVRDAFPFDATSVPQEGATRPVAHDGRFRDVPPDHVFHASIEKLAASGVTRGCSDVDFCPDRDVTRGQMAAFLRRAMELPAGSMTFADVPSSHVFRSDIAALGSSGITSGCGDGRTYCPDAPVTRGQMAVFLQRALGLPAGVALFDDVPLGHPFSRSIGALAASRITRGCGTTSFCPDQPVTRAQMAAFLDRAGLLD